MIKIKKTASDTKRNPFCELMEINAVLQIGQYLIDEFEKDDKADNETKRINKKSKEE